MVISKLSMRKLKLMDVELTEVGRNILQGIPYSISNKVED